MILQDILKMWQDCDVVSLGTIGGLKWDDPKVKVHAEDGLHCLKVGG